MIRTRPARLDRVTLLVEFRGIILLSLQRTSLHRSETFPAQDITAAATAILRRKFKLYHPRQAFIL
jgi:hypothetical protein